MVYHQGFGKVGEQMGCACQMISPTGEAQASTALGIDTPPDGGKTNSERWPYQNPIKTPLKPINIIFKTDPNPIKTLSKTISNPINLGFAIRLFGLTLPLTGAASMPKSTPRPAVNQG
jgi:hypothetical protein